jgi:hypothetical protein
VGEVERMLKDVEWADVGGEGSLKPRAIDVMMGVCRTRGVEWGVETEVRVNEEKERKKREMERLRDEWEKRRKK